MDTSKIQAFPPMRKISLSRLKNLQKLIVYGKFSHQTIKWKSLYFTRWISREKQIPNWSTLANISGSKKSFLRHSKNNYGLHLVFDGYGIDKFIGLDFLFSLVSLFLATQALFFLSFFNILEDIQALMFHWPYP